jgi:hypothetical protein
MEPQTSDQRGTRRFALRLPVSVRFGEEGGGEAVAHTRDVSARGVFFLLDSPLAEGSRLEFTLTLPPEVTLTDSIRVRCQGRVVRVDPKQPNGKVGIAAVIEHYEFLGERD